MAHPIPILRYLVHKACAYPYAICWVAGTVLLWIPLSLHLYWSGIFRYLATDWKTAVLLVICYACFSGLAFIGGAIFLGWWVKPRCCRWNGAPHEAGGRVVVLSGRNAGREGIVAAISCGQGGRLLQRVESERDGGECLGEFFEEYEVLRWPRGE